MDFKDKPRREQARLRRNCATDLSSAAEHPQHVANRDNKTPYVFNFTKGLEHGPNGLLIDPTHFETFRAGTETHDPRVFADTPPAKDNYLTEDPAQFATLKCKADHNVYRQWESPTAGHAYAMEGPDPQAVTMPPAPEVGSAEFAAEMAEVYQMARARDLPVAAFMPDSLIATLININGTPVGKGAIDLIKKANRTVSIYAGELSALRWFGGTYTDKDVMVKEQRERRRFGHKQSATNLFRGMGEDGWDTPFLSQFMVMGSGGCEREIGQRATGQIGYGAQQIDQKVRVAIPGQDYMMTWADWLDVQNGLNKRALVKDRGQEFIKGARRPIARLRDMATYVHDDQLYQAYLNAALILLDEKYPFDPGLPFHGKSANPLSRDNREPFALFGPPHLLTLVTEVSSRALKAVRYQKFSVHRRLRPEAAAALFHTVFTEYHPHKSLKGTAPYAENDGSVEAKARWQIARDVARAYTHPYVADKPKGPEPALDPILSAVLAHNLKETKENSWLLPMAFPEGSPMHPSYGAGHATVAGACVTLLKAFFDMQDPDAPDSPALLVKRDGIALVPDGGAAPDSVNIDMLGLKMPQGLTLEGELNKLMWNISNARNIAGVHYYTDYIESALLGEAITLGILREQMMMYHAEEKVTLTVPLLVPRTLPACLIHDGSIGKDEMVSAVRILSDGTLESVSATPGRTPN